MAGCRADMTQVFQKIMDNATIIDTNNADKQRVAVIVETVDRQIARAPDC